MSALLCQGVPGTAPLLALLCHLLFLHTPSTHISVPLSTIHPSSPLHIPLISLPTLLQYPLSTSLLSRLHSQPHPKGDGIPTSSWQGTCTSFLITLMDFLGVIFSFQEGTLPWGLDSPYPYILPTEES